MERVREPIGKNILDPSLLNPCDTPVLRKIFGHPKPKQWTILDKDVVDEMIFRTENPRNRLILELMARCGMRIYPPHSDTLEELATSKG